MILTVLLLIRDGRDHMSLAAQYDAAKNCSNGTEV